MQAHLQQQRQLLLSAAAFPHNAWRMCSRCCTQQAAAHRRFPIEHVSTQQHHSSSASHAAAPGQPSYPGRSGGFHGQQQISGRYLQTDQSRPQAAGSQDDLGAAPNIQLPHLTPPIPPRPPAALSWIPPQLLTHLQALLGFLKACWALLPEFVSPSLSEATRRLCLVLGASLVMVVLVSTIDSGWLYLYLLNARRVAA